MKKIIDYWPLLTVILLYFAFCNIYYYYKEFNVEISSYIANTDIFLSFLPTIVLITYSLFGFFFSQIIQILKRPGPIITDEQIELNEHKKGKRTQWMRKNIQLMSVLFYLGATLLIVAIEFIFHFKPYELKEPLFFIDFIFLGLIYIGITIHENRYLVLQNSMLLLLFIIVFIGYRIGYYRAFDAMKIKDGKTDTRKDHISFKYNNSKFKTSDSVIYEGSTSNYMFLYNRKDSSTAVYPMSKIEDLILK